MNTNYKIKLNVTKEDIENAEPESIENCPLARSIRREYKAERVFVNCDAIFIQRKTTCHAFKITPEIAAFTKAFDMVKSASPLTLISTSIGYGRRVGKNVCKAKTVNVWCTRPM